MDKTEPSQTQTNSTQNQAPKLYDPAFPFWLFRNGNGNVIEPAQVAAKEEQKNKKRDYFCRPPDPNVEGREASSA